MTHFLEKRFHLTELKTNSKTEFIAGTTTFLTMAYVLATVPNMLSDTGLNKGSLLSSMILMIVLTSIAMGIVSNKPFVLGPGLGSVGIIAGMLAGGSTSISEAAGVIFWGGILFVIISYVGLRDQVINAIPKSLKHAVSAGVGTLITIIGGKSVGLIVANPNKNVLNIGDITQPAIILTLIGLVLILIGKARNIRGYIIFSIIITTILGIPMGVTKLPATLLSLPENPFTHFMQIDILGAVNFKFIPFFMALFMTDFFSTFGTAYGVGAKAGLVDKDGNLPGIDKVFKVDAVSTVLGSTFCIPCMTTYLESASGVEVGGKSGLTAISTSLWFILALLLSPLALIVPAAATAPALIFIGIDMLSALRHLDFDDVTEYFPALVCIAFAIFANSIADGICFSVISYVLLKLAAGKIREMPKMTIALVIMALLFFLTTYVI